MAGGWIELLVATNTELYTLHPGTYTLKLTLIPYSGR